MKRNMVYYVRSTEAFRYYIALIDELARWEFGESFEIIMRLMFYTIHMPAYHAHIFII